MQLKQTQRLLCNLKKLVKQSQIWKTVGSVVNDNRPDLELVVTQALAHDKVNYNRKPF